MIRKSSSTRGLEGRDTTEEHSAVRKRLVGCPTGTCIARVKNKWTKPRSRKKSNPFADNNILSKRWGVVVGGTQSDA